MKPIKILFVQGLLLASLLVSFNVSAADQSICDPDANVALYDDGSLESCQLKNNYDVNDITCKNGGTISFYENGKIESCVLYEEITLSDTKCKPDAPISFYMDGKLKSCIKQEQ